MKDETAKDEKQKTDLWTSIQEKLLDKGIDLEQMCSGEVDPSRVKVVCITPNLESSVKEMGQTPRGQTVMVRIDEESSKSLDSWVETGYFRSRSEAAALFIREGLKVRLSELEQLKEDLHKVEQAKKRLHERARKIFGENK